MSPLAHYPTLLTISHFPPPLYIQVHVDTPRWRMMLCYDWDTTSLARLCTDPRSSCLWVAPMNQINFKAVARLKAKGGYKRAVAFQPTGWSFGSSGGGAVSHLQQRVNKDGDIIVSVPYSEHSSFRELVDCIQLLK